jgi:hypothetical protein
LEPFSKVRGLFRTVSDTQCVDKKYSEKLSSYSQITDQPPLIVFPGGGIYFWWQVSIGQSERKPWHIPMHISNIDISAYLCDVFRNQVKVMKRTGTFFQAGAVKALQERYDIDKCCLTGASAGALIAVLACCKIDMDYALDVAERSKCSRFSALPGFSHQE